LQRCFEVGYVGAMSSRAPSRPNVGHAGVAAEGAATEPAPLAETRSELVGRYQKRFGALSVELLVQHVLDTAQTTDFAVLEAALAALTRRWEFARQDELGVSERPPVGQLLGRYTTATAPSKVSKGAKKGKPARRVVRRPYTSYLEGLNPIKGNCDCPDFVRSSLGLCKHLLVVIENVLSKRRPAVPLPVNAATPAFDLTWEPHLALLGQLDRLAGLRFDITAAPATRAGSLQKHLPDFDAVFSSGAPSPRSLKTPEARLRILKALSTAMSGSSRARFSLSASPAARLIVREELERVEQTIRNATAAARTLRHLSSLQRSLYAYQREGVERFISCGRLLLADDMGLGKTTQAIAAGHALFREGRVRRGLIVVPSSLKPQWHREWQDTTRVPAQIVEGTPAERARIYRQCDSGFLIIGYEQLLRDFEHVQRFNPELVVLDEAQRIKNYATKSAIYVKALNPEFRLVLTGTPMENRLEELASILDWVDDLALAPKWRLVPWYTRWESNATSAGRSGARNLDTLRLRMGDSVLRRVRRDVLAQLPARTDTRVPVELTPQQREEHDAFNQVIAKLVAVRQRRPLSQKEFLQLMQALTQQRIICNGLGQARFEQLWPTYCDAQPDPALIDGLFAPKLKELRRLVSDLVITQERKIVVFSQWRRMLRLAEWSIRDLLAGAGLRASFFTGAESTAQRTRNVVDFHDDPQLRVLFLSDAGGVGLNLQRAASACINLELPWNPAVLEQRIGRIYRLGQKRAIDVYNLVSEEGIESRIAALVGTKQALFSGVFDGTTDEISFEAAAPFLTQVERLVDTVMPVAPSIKGAADEDVVTLASELETELPDAVSPPPTRRSSALAAAKAAAGEATQVAGTPSRTPDTLGSSVGELLGSLSVVKLPNGAVRFEAQPEAAQSLIALFAGMAQLLGSSLPSATADAEVAPKLQRRSSSRTQRGLGGE
jgi:hypothetical protein